MLATGQIVSSYGYIGDSSINRIVSDLMGQCRTCSRQVDQEEAAPHETTLSTCQETGLEARQLLGILWPAPVYQAHTGKEPAPESIIKLKIGGSMVSGVLRDPQFGRPAGRVMVVLI